jgi:hypothetical protein
MQNFFWQMQVSLLQRHFFFWRMRLCFWRMRSFLLADANCFWRTQLCFWRRKKCIREKKTIASARNHLRSAKGNNRIRQKPPASARKTGASGKSNLRQKNDTRQKLITSTNQKNSIRSKPITSIIEKNFIRQEPFTSDQRKPASAETICIRRKKCIRKKKCVE